MASNVIDYLFEDPVIPSQKYALVTIVGPNMPQKCDVWGMKIRGVYDTIDSAKSASKHLMQIDPNYDIYTTEVGKFFPLHVDPLTVQSVEYDNEQLNELIHSYMKNKNDANDEWLKRKNEMVAEAIKEGQNSQRVQTPVDVLRQLYSMKTRKSQIEEELAKVNGDLEKLEEIFDKFSAEEQESAKNQINNVVEK